MTRAPRTLVGLFDVCFLLEYEGLQAVDRNCS